MDNVDLILLDVNLPDGNGFDFCKEIREELSTPIIFLTACYMEIYIIIGLELGEEDYITKPFSLIILKARVMAALRRKVSQKLTNKICIDDMIFDFERMEFSRLDVPIILSKTEQKLLKVLVTNRGEILTRDQIIDRVWSDGGEFVDENDLTVAIERLREKVEDKKTSMKYIKTL